MLLSTTIKPLLNYILVEAEYIQCLARRCSNYYECLKLIAYRYRYVVSKFIDKGSNLNVSLETGCLKNTELKHSMIDLIRLAQENYFDKQNIACIASHGLSNALQCCKKCDRAKLAKSKNLLVFYDDHEKVLRVGGRIIKASLPSETVHQYVLPKSHFITALIVKYEHRLANHFGANYVLSRLMEKFWICGGLSTVRKLLLDCFYCKVRRAKAESQVMGDLPECRVTVPKFPFEHTGTDLFGPLGVIVGRSIAKRWGVLFICMATRACHIEIVPDLSADSFIQCFFVFFHAGDCIVSACIPIRVPTS